MKLMDMIYSNIEKVPLGVIVKDDFHITIKGIQLEEQSMVCSLNSRY
jgi:hypothetical protein